MSASRHQQTRGARGASGAGNARNTLQNGLLAFDATLDRVPRAGMFIGSTRIRAGFWCARTPEAHTALVAALATREIRRGYVALCTGVMTGGGTVNEPSVVTEPCARAWPCAPMARRRYAFCILRRLRAHTLVSVELERGARIRFGCTWRIWLSMVGIRSTVDAAVCLRGKRRSHSRACRLKRQRCTRHGWV